MRIWLLLVALLAVLTLALPMALTRPGTPGAGLAETPVQGAVSSPSDRPAPTDWPAIGPSLAASEAAATPDPTPATPASATLAGRESFRVLDRTTGAVSTVSARDYVLGALASEMPGTFHAEALAAQAVAAHTWALYCAEWQSQHPDPLLKGADFDADPTRDEGYITEARARERYGESFDLYWPKLTAAADYALGHALTYEGHPVLAAYHSTSAGVTEDAENVWLSSIPYLTAVESEGDRLAPNFQVQETFARDELRDRLLSRFPQATFADGKEAEWLVPVERSAGGYITSVSVGGQTVHGKEVRAALGLRSSCFTVDYADDVFTLETSGYGHGVGLSQYGADFMARQGEDCASILTHYYPGTTLATVTHDDVGA